LTNAALVSPTDAEILEEALRFFDRTCGKWRGQQVSEYKCANCDSGECLSYDVIVELQRIMDNALALAYDAGQLLAVLAAQPKLAYDAIVELQRIMDNELALAYDAGQLLAVLAAQPKLAYDAGQLLAALYPFGTPEDDHAPSMVCISFKFERSE